MGWRITPSRCTVETSSLIRERRLELGMPRTCAMKCRNDSGVMSGYAGAPSGRYPILSLTLIGSSLTSCPQTTAVPEVGVRKPVTIFMVVDFPAPFGPRKPSTSPRWTWKETLSTAVNEPNRRVSLRMSIMGFPARDRNANNWTASTSRVRQDSYTHEDACGKQSRRERT